jgi:glutaredoxin 3
MKEVKIYTTTYCPYCKKAKVLFDQMDVAYQEINIEQDEKLRDELIAKYNWQTVPMIVIGDKFIGGFDDVAKLHLEGKLKAEIGVE